MHWPRSPDDEDQGDWLAGCHGFVVESGAGRVGRLEAVERDPDSGRPLALVVGAGMAAHRRLRIPVEDVAGVVPSSGRIVLNGSRAPTSDREHALTSEA